MSPLIRIVSASHRVSRTLSLSLFCQVICSSQIRITAECTQRRGSDRLVTQASNSALNGGIDQLAIGSRSN